MNDKSKGSERMRLLIDVGNTRIKVGLFDTQPPAPQQLPLCHHAWAIAVTKPFLWDVLRERLGGDLSCLTSCVTGSNMSCVRRLLSEWPDDCPVPGPIPRREEFPLEVDVEFPERVGIDRLLNAVAVNGIRSPAEPAIVIDSGTATTIDYIDCQGTFCGGAILPGFDLNARALHQYTDQLPLFTLREMPDSPPADLGRNTEQAIHSGLYWGHVGAVREIVERLSRRAVKQSSAEDSPGVFSQDRFPRLVLTGGAAGLLSPHLGKNRQVEPHLTLQGLALVCATK